MAKKEILAPAPPAGKKGARGAGGPKKQLTGRQKAAIFIITNIFTEIITNNAAAAITFPIAYAAATQLGVDPKPLFITICIAASASFSTPIGYQTNLIVQSIGNYKFSDYWKIGLPLNLLALIISLVVIPIFWPF